MTNVPDRVAFETPRGRITTGDVVDDVWRPGADEHLLIVEHEGHRFRVDESEAEPAS